MSAAHAGSAELRATVPLDQVDYLVPQFVLQRVPSGLRAVIFSALLTAAMSSLDSALNSLSAATMRDFIQRRRSGSSVRGSTGCGGTSAVWR